MTESCRNCLVDRRKAEGWSQEALASRSGLSRAAISAIETGRVVPSTAAALALANAFRCAVEDLFSLVPPPGGLEWAWPPAAGGGRFWRAEVGDRVRAYPSENTPVGYLPHDGVVRQGRFDVSDSGDPRNRLVIAGCDPAVGLLAAGLERDSQVRLLPIPRSSRNALDLMSKGLVHAAGVHLGDPGNEATVRSLLGRGYRLLHIVRWEEGIVVDPGLGLSGPGAALRARLRWVGREEGSGARRCLDRLRGRGRRSSTYAHLAADHRGVVEAVRNGWAQAGVCVRLVTEGSGLGFFSAQVEDYELCYRSDFESDPRFAALLRTVRSVAYRRQMADLPGCQTELTGEVRRVE